MFYFVFRTIVASCSGNFSTTVCNFTVVCAHRTLDMHRILVFGTKVLPALLFVGAARLVYLEVTAPPTAIEIEVLERRRRRRDGEERTQQGDIPEPSPADLIAGSTPTHMTSGATHSQCDGIAATIPSRLTETNS